MRQETLSPDSYTFNALVSMFCNMGDVVRAEASCNEMAKLRIRPDTITYDSLCQMFGQLASHIRVVELIARTGTTGLWHLLTMKTHARNSSLVPPTSVV